MTDIPDPQMVFLVHGRDHVARVAVIEFLAALGVSTMPWRKAKALASQQNGTASPSILQIITSGMAACQGLVVLFTPDDFAHLRDDLWRAGDGDRERRSSGQPRQNVMFEAGAAMALYPRRTILVEVGDIRPASDLDGVYRLRLGSDESRHEFRQAIIDAECMVGGGSEYLKAGRFVTPIQERYQRWIENGYRWTDLLPESDVQDLQHRGSSHLTEALSAYVLISAIQHGWGRHGTCSSIRETRWRSKHSSILS